MYVENDSMNWTDFFACSYKFRKAKSYFNNYLVVMVKNGEGLIDHRTAKQVYLTNDLMNLGG